MAWGMCGREACLQGRCVADWVGHVWQGGVCGGRHMGDMHSEHMHGEQVYDRGHVWQEVCMTGGGGYMCGRGACIAGEMATAVDGMHPTGMHSCYKLIQKAIIATMLTSTLTICVNRTFKSELVENAK